MFMDKLAKKVLNTIRRQQLIPQGSDVICGFSGGGDSVCLLSVLSELKAVLQIRLQAVHINHELRGQEADADEAFCRAFAESRGIAFTAVHVHVKQLVQKEGLSVEEAARILRYQALEKTAGSGGLIAVAHHADDQAETILMNLLRGTGLKGMAGMEPKRGRVIRPLLEVGKEEIQSYLERNELSYVTDSSNLSDDYTRNRIRHELLPAMKNINEQACLHLLKTGRAARQAQDYLEREAQQWLFENSSTGEGIIRFSRKKLKDRPQIFRSYVIIGALRELNTGLKDWGEVHIAEIDEALGGPKGIHLDLPDGFSAENTYEEIIIRKGSHYGKTELHDQNADF